MKNRYILQAIGILIFFCIIVLYGYLEFSIEQWIKKNIYIVGGATCHMFLIANSLLFVLAGAALGLPKYILYRNSFDFKLFLLFLIPGLIYLSYYPILYVLKEVEFSRIFFHLMYIYKFIEHPYLASLLIGIGISRATTPIEKRSLKY